MRKEFFKKTLIWLLLLSSPTLLLAQINNKIEGIIFNAPCEILYIRNLDNQNNYSCNLVKGNRITNYSIQVTNLFNELNGFDRKRQKIFKEEYLKTMKDNSEKLNEEAEYLIIKDKRKALKITAFLNYSGIKFKNTSLAFIYKNKGFIINITSNDMSKSNIKEIIKRLKFK